MTAILDIVKYLSRNCVYGEEIYSTRNDLRMLNWSKISISKISHFSSLSRWICPNQFILIGLRWNISKIIFYQLKYIILTYILSKLLIGQNFASSNSNSSTRKQLCDYLWKKIEQAMTKQQETTTEKQDLIWKKTFFIIFVDFSKKNILA